MLQRLKYGLQRFMMGRNGSDTLGWVALGLGLGIVLLASVPRLAGMSGLAWVGLAYSIFRTYSRNVAKRREENLRFTGLFRRLKARLTDRQHRYFACPQCGQTVRVPRGKGMIKIRCPKCRTQFEKKS